MSIKDLNKATSELTADALAEILKTPNLRKAPRLLKEAEKATDSL